MDCQGIKGACQCPRTSNLALKSLASLETGFHKQVQLDNSTAVAYINNMWGGGGLLNPNNLMTLH